MKNKTKTIDETRHLMDNPNNAKRLMDGIKELERLKEKNKSGAFVVTIKDGDHYCSYSSLLNVSGYGKNKEDSLASFQHNVLVLMQDLQDLKNEISAKTAAEYLEKFEALKNWVKSLNDNLQIQSQIELTEKRLRELI